MNRRTIVRAALVLMLGSAASRVLGFGREAVVVGLFGLSASASAFVTAATVPTMIYDLLVGGAISAALIPVLGDLTRAKGTAPPGREIVAAGPAHPPQRAGAAPTAATDPPPGLRDGVDAAPAAIDRLTGAVSTVGRDLADGAATDRDDRADATSADRHDRADATSPDRHDLPGAALPPDLHEFGQVAGSLLSLTVAATAALALALEVAAPQVVAALGASRQPEVAEATLAMLRILLPSVVLLGAAGVVQAMLQARGIFGYTAVSAACFNLGIIVGGLALAWLLGPIALAIGMLVGAALQLAVQLPGLRGVPIRLVPDLANPGVHRALRLYAPVAAGLLLSQVGIVIDRNLAWQTGEASIAIMRSATTLVQLPLGLVATATSFAVLPALARARDEREFAGTLAFGVRLSLLAMVPITVGLLLLREPVVRVLFQRAAFGPLDTALTAEAFIWYAPQMPFWAVDQLLIFAFYARKDTITPVVVGVVGTLLYLIVAFAAVGPLGVHGLILANTVQNSLHCVMMYVLLRKIGFSLAGEGIERGLATVLGSTLAAGLAYLAASALLGPPPAAWLGSALWLTIIGAAMAAATVAALAALGAPELRQAVAVARRRLGR